MMSSKDYPQPEPINGLENLSDSWLEECLSSYYQKEIEIKRWHGKTPDSRQGYLSEILYVDVDFVLGDEKNETRISLVFKLSPRSKEMKNLVERSWASHREIMLYKFVCGKSMRKIYEELGLDLPLPEVLYSRMTSKAITLVMRNLSLDGFEMLDRKSLGLEEVKTYMRNVALFHACGVIYKNRVGSEAMEEALNSPPVNLDYNEDFVRRGFVYLHHLYKGNPQSHLLLKWSEKWKYTLDLPWINMTMKTCVHGDFWVNNVMYNTSTRKVKILDWQMSHFGNPVMDIIAMLTISTQPSLLENHLYEILGAYWDSYSTSIGRAGIVVKETFEGLLENVRSLWMYGLGILAAGIELFLPTGMIENADLMAVVDFFYKKGFLDLPCDDKLKNQ